jgi:hypothetical protein
MPSRWEVYGIRAKTDLAFLRAMDSSTALQMSSAGVLSSTGSTFSPIVPIFQNSITVRLDRNNFLLWKTQVIPNLSCNGYLGYLDGSCPAPPKLITTGTGNDAVTAPNPAYTTWWHTDQRVLNALLGSMTEEVLAQMIGRTTSTEVWKCLNSMFSAQGRASIRQIRRKLASTKKNDLGAAEYFHKMKGFADAMATVGTPLPDDELIDYIIAGLGTPFAPLQASLTVFANANPDAVLNLSDFYAMLLSYEAMQEQNSQAAVEYSSSANAAGRRGDYGRGGGRP